MVFSPGIGSGALSIPNTSLANSKSDSSCSLCFLFLLFQLLLSLKLLQSFFLLLFSNSFLKWLLLLFDRLRHRRFCLFIFIIVIPVVQDIIVFIFSLPLA